MICSICGKKCWNVRFVLPNRNFICQKCFIEKYCSKEPVKKVRVRVKKTVERRI